MKSLLLGCGMVVLLVLLGIGGCTYMAWKTVAALPPDAQREALFAKHKNLIDRLDAAIRGSADFATAAERIKSEAALAKLAGISPIPASSGMTSGRHRINHGGHRQLNAAIYRTVIGRMRFHQPTIEYVTRRTTEGLSKRDIIRCLKRYVIREVFHLVCPAENAVQKTS